MLCTTSLLSIATLLGGTGRCVQVSVVAKHRRKRAVRHQVVRTGDIEPPYFTQPPLIQATTTSFMVTFGSSEPATVHAVVVYDDVSSEFRYRLLGFESSDLSTDQVLEVTARGGEIMRRLQLSKMADTMGPIVGFNTSQVTAANEITEVMLQPPCLDGTGMCLLHDDGLNPITRYKVCSARACAASVNPSET